MKVEKIVGIILVVFGALIILGAALANFLPGSSPSFGFSQIVGIVVGAIDVVLGLVLLLKKKSS